MDIKDDLNAWRALLLTAKTGKVSMASIMLDTSTAKVSRLISGLEAELGYPLFDKTKRPLQTTHRCKQLLSVVEPLLKDFQEIQSPSFGLSKRTLIRVAAPIEGSLDFHCSNFMSYADNNQNVEIEVMPEATEQDVRDGRVDVAMLNHVPDDSSEFKIRMVATTTTTPFATPQYLRRYGIPKKLDDLKFHRGLLLKTRTFPVTRFLFKEQQTSSVLQWRTVFYTHDQSMLKKLLLNHCGITVDLYGGHIIHELLAGEIVPVLPGWTRQAWNMCIVTRQDVEMTNKQVRDFASWWYSVESSTDQDRMTKSVEACKVSLEKNAEFFK